MYGVESEEWGVEYLVGSEAHELLLIHQKLLLDSDDRTLFGNGVEPLVFYVQGMGFILIRVQTPVIPARANTQQRSHDSNESAGYHTLTHTYTPDVRYAGNRWPREQ